MAIWRRVACWINEATQALAHARARVPAPTHARTRARAHTRTHTQKCLTFCFFLRQQWFRESVSMLHYTYIASLVCS